MWGPLRVAPAGHSSGVPGEARTWPWDAARSRGFAPGLHTHVGEPLQSQQNSSSPSFCFKLMPFSSQPATSPAPQRPLPPFFSSPLPRQPPVPVFPFGCQRFCQLYPKMGHGHSRQRYLNLLPTHFLSGLKMFQSFPTSISILIVILL